MTLSRLLFVDGTPEQLQAYCRERLEIEITPEHAALILANTITRSRSGHYKLDDLSLMVLKNRLHDLNYFPHGSDETKIHANDYSLHFFFVSLEETEEMLTRLRRPDQSFYVRAEARSKLFTTEQYVQPVDAVAARVAGDHA